MRTYSALAFIVWLCLIGISFAQESKPPFPSAPQSQQVKPPEGGQSQQSSAPEERGTTEKPIFVKILPAEKTETERAQEQQDRADKAASDWWNSTLTAALVGVGVLQFLVLIGQAIVFGIQAKRLRESVDLTRNIAKQQELDVKASIKEAARAANSMDRLATATQQSVVASINAVVVSQRAWLRVYIAMGNQPLIFGATGATTSISVRIRNVGNLPAKDVSIHAWLAVEKSGGPSVSQEHEIRCEQIRHGPASGIASVIFPNECFPKSIGRSEYNPGVHVEASDIDIGRKASADGNHILMNVVGCVNYSFDSDPGKYHQTRFNYALHHDGNMVVRISDPIPPSLLALRPALSSGAHYAD